MKEKVAALIDKLQELKSEEASISELSHYTKLLYAELMCAKGENDRKQSTRKVSVIMPGYDTRQEEKKNEARPVAVDNVTAGHQEFEWQKQDAPPVKEKVLPAQEVPVVAEREVPAVAEETMAGKQASLWEKPQAVSNEPQPADPPKQSPKELNDLIAEQRPSLNDRLKTSREEVANRLGNASVKSLNQAIGLNEKFGYINDLFRGDQLLYERSIQTIDNCKDLKEAMYWIERELKIKLGWLEKDETVQRFYTLIKKRFS